MHVAHTAGHKERTDARGARREVRLLGNERSWPGRFGFTCARGSHMIRREHALLIQQPGQRNAAHAAARLKQEIASRPERFHRCTVLLELCRKFFMACEQTHSY